MSNKKPMILVLISLTFWEKRKKKDTIITRYFKSLKNIQVLMDLCDILHVYDNSIEPTRIVRKHKEDISIFPNELWSEEKLMELIG